jgi:hypothetical protein
MPEWVEVKTQDELDRALQRPEAIPVCVGAATFTVSVPPTRVVRATDSTVLEASGTGTVEAWGDARVRASGSLTVGAWQSARVEADGEILVEAWDSASITVRGSSTVRLWGWASASAHDSSRVEAENWTTVHADDDAAVEAWGFAAVQAFGSANVRAWDNARVRAWDWATVRAWGTATVDAWGEAKLHVWDATTVRAGGSAQVTARGTASVRLRGEASVEASEHVSVIRHGPKTRASGGVVNEVPVRLKTAQEWCDFYGVPVQDGVAILFKAVDGEYFSTYGTSYRPGSEPQADDWDDGERECGGGLHFSPTPALALQFSPRAVRFVACPVRLEDISISGREANAAKVKARGVCAPVYEVDEAGRPLAPGAESPRSRA